MEETTKMNESEKFLLDKECKHSRRYACVDQDYPIKSIYVNRDYADGKDIIFISIGVPEK